MLTLMLQFVKHKELIMILNQYYADSDNHKVYLSDVVNGRAFYVLGKELITATVDFFESKYKLLKE